MGACCAPQNRAAVDSVEADVAVYASSKTPENKVLDDAKGTEPIAEPEGADPYIGLPIGIALDGHALQVHMQGAPKPPCEEERLATVKVLGDLEYPESSELASILKVIRNIFKSPLAMISLFGDNRIFAFQTDGFFERGDTPPRFMFCSWQMATPNAQVTYAVIWPGLYTDAHGLLPRSYMTLVD
ncbi:hypothetical protein QJQ45_004130 [Haematococcus lacustris]|nr:hypothetical protein QJQ45_004130 [Haematococcus lacustris]